MRRVVTRVVTIAEILLLAGVAQKAAFILSYHGVRSAFGVSGPICPTLPMRIMSAGAYLGLLALLASLVGVAACRVERKGFGAVRAVVAGAVLGSAFFIGTHGLAMRVSAVRAAALANVTAASAIFAWGHAATVAVGAAIGFANRRGGRTRG